MAIDLYDVVTKLAGPIHPVGDTNIDEERYESLIALTLLVDRLISDIDQVATKNKKRHEYSMKRAATFADGFLTKLGIVE